MSAAIGDPESVCAALAALFDGQTAAVGADTVTLHGHNPPPPKLDTAELPAVYAFTGQAVDSETQDGAEWAWEARTYAVQCAVMPLGQGTPEEREKRCRPILVAVKNRLRAYPHLGVAGVQRARVLGDSGIVVLPEYGEAFIGFEVRVQVSVQIARAYAANE